MSDWTELENIRREWAAEDLDPKADLEAWREGNRVYEAHDDYESMMRAGALLAQALRHSLYGSGLLTQDDLRETTHRVLFSSAFPPPDGRTLRTEAAVRLRLGLTIVKKEGWQSSEHGGDGTMGEFLEASYWILSCAVAPSKERPWEGNLKRFFTTGTVEIDDAPPAAESRRDSRGMTDREFSEALADQHGAAMDAKTGEPAAEARMRGMSLSWSEQPEAALLHYEEAARLGSVDGMFDAGMTALELGQTTQGLSWLERAAAAGHAKAMYNLGAAAHGGGELETASSFWERAATAGEPAGYAALAQAAAERGDDAAEARWAQLGAEAGHPYCQLRHGQLLMQSAPDNLPLIRGQAIPLLEAAAEAEIDSAHFLVGIAYGQLREPSTARLWLLRAEQRGDGEATRVLDEHQLR